MSGTNDRLPVIEELINLFSLIIASQRPITPGSFYRNVGVFLPFNPRDDSEWSAGQRSLLAVQSFLCCNLFQRRMLCKLRTLSARKDVISGRDPCSVHLLDTSCPLLPPRWDEPPPWVPWDFELTPAIQWTIFQDTTHFHHYRCFTLLQELT